MSKAGPGPTQQLPKATVQLAKSTTPISKAPPPSIAAKRSEEEYEEEKDPEAGLAPLAVVCMFLALVLMAVNLLGTDATFPVEEGSESPFLVPSPSMPSWEQKQSDGTYKSTFETKLGAVTKALE